MRFGKTENVVVPTRKSEPVSEEVEVVKPLQPSAPAAEKVADKPKPRVRHALSRKDRRRIEAARSAADVLRSRGFATSSAVDSIEVRGLADWILDEELQHVDLTQPQRGLRDELLAFLSWFGEPDGLGDEDNANELLDAYFRFRDAAVVDEASEAADAAEDDDDKSDQITRLDVGSQVEIRVSPYSAEEARVGRRGELVRFQEGTGAALATLRTPSGVDYTFAPDQLRRLPQLDPKGDLTLGA